jgi:hypothetical protein
MFVAGVDGCRAGWVAFKVEISSLATSVELVDVPKLLKSRSGDLLCLAIDSYFDLAHKTLDVQYSISGRTLGFP